MTKYPCGTCGRLRANIKNAKCLDCQMNINPEVIESGQLRERQLTLDGKALTIFH